MAENKTVPTDQGVEDFLYSIADEQKREDSFTLVDLMREVTGLEPQMWGSSIVGFGSYHYRQLPLQVCEWARGRYDAGWLRAAQAKSDDLQHGRH
jgi:hypothetical protein